MPAENPVLNFHEQRLNDLEASHTDLAKELSQHGERIEHLAQRVDETRQELGEKLDKIDAKLDAHDDHAAALSQRVGKLEEGAARFGKLKKAAIGLLLAGLGVLVKEGVVLLLHHLTR